MSGSESGWFKPRRARLPAPADGAQPKGFAGVRLSFEQADASLAAAADRLALPASPWGADFDILAISGGAAGGAFAAGALAGLTRAGRRPNFAIVTGVSTGALIAPFAFLGPEWDERLADAYTGGHAAQAFSLSGVSPLLDGGVFKPDALERLVGPFVDEALIDAVAAQHRLGRRLLVATTDLDRQTPCIWDMGEIASRGGEGAVRMFRDVLIASAAMPGLFPPRRFLVERDGRDYEELHADGGLAAPLFIMPEALLHWRQLGRRMRGGRVHVLINTVLDPAPRTTAINLPAILMRSFDTMLRVSYRQALNVAVTFCVAHNLSLSVASIPDAASATEPGGMLNFETAAMRRLFESAEVAAQRPDFWSQPAARLDPWSEFLKFLQAR